VLFTAGDMRWPLVGLAECVTGRAAIEQAFGKNIFERHANAEESALFNRAMAFSAALSP
jgi:hypothetical protein